MNMNELFSVGDKIYGYCNGYFGRDDYNDKTCILVTNKYAVFENEEGYCTVLNLGHHYVPLTFKTVKEWKDKINSVNHI